MQVPGTRISLVIASPAKDPSEVQTPRGILRCAQDDKSDLPDASARSGRSRRLGLNPLSQTWERVGAVAPPGEGRVRAG